MDSLRVQIRKTLKEAVRAPLSPRIGPGIPSHIGMGYIDMGLMYGCKGALG